MPKGNNCYQHVQYLMTLAYQLQQKSTRVIISKMAAKMAANNDDIIREYAFKL